ncbi:MAG TPA: hypothetical protein VNO17_00445 [Actinomycetota bacterium]|nr:hypothetical protein [Actinomycetota bacterium]
MTTRRSAVPALLAAALLAGCSTTGQAEPTTSPTSPPPSPTGSPIVSVGTRPGHYEYVNAGIVARLVFDRRGGSASLQIENGSGHDLGEPFIYVLDARDGHEIDGTVVDAAPIPKGRTARFRVEFPDELDVDQIGLAILVLGEDNYGAFVPV